MNILIIGSGALATLFAARLSGAGINVTMLGTWPEGLAALREGGARLEGDGDYTVQATNNPADCRGMKFALVLVKSWQTERAARQLPDCLAGDGLVVTVQNGLGNDEILSGVLGPMRVSRGVTTLGATLLAPGFVRSGGEGAVTLEIHPQLAGLQEMLRAARFDLRVVEDAQPFVWGKLLVNAAINPLTALLRVKNGELIANQPARELMGELAQEAASVAKALGVTLPFSNPERAVEEVAQRTASNISSMLQDILRGAPTEVDAINGAVVRKGEEKNVPTPVNQMIWSLVKALSKRGKI
ncbi:MAG: 2-dehydropantoate 2-reductase [Anaerolineales bacterium]|jgi:2-dehydropantoate 2-reductase